MFQVAGNHTLDAPRAEVWPRIFDPSTLMNLIPGCDDLEETSPGTYVAHIHVGFAGITGIYRSEVRILEQSPPERCSFFGELSGPTGIASGNAAFRLDAAGEATQVSYEITGQISGALARLPPHMLEGAIGALIKRGLSMLNEQILEEGRGLGSRRRRH